MNCCECYEAFRIFPQPFGMPLILQIAGFRFFPIPSEKNRFVHPARVHVRKNLVTVSPSLNGFSTFRSNQLKPMNFIM